MFCSNLSLFNNSLNYLLAYCTFLANTFRHFTSTLVLYSAALMIISLRSIFHKNEQQLNGLVLLRRTFIILLSSLSFLISWDTILNWKLWHKCCAEFTPQPWRHSCRTHEGRLADSRDKLWMRVTSLKFLESEDENE